MHTREMKPEGRQPTGLSRSVVPLPPGAEAPASSGEPQFRQGAHSVGSCEGEGHPRRVVGYAAALGHRMGVPERRFPRLLGGAMLHDLGKIEVPNSILHKPGPLTAREWAAMKTHPELGYRLLCRIGFSNEDLPAVRYHHERYDGTGYPDGLAGERIPLDARIIAVADAFDAMTSHRPYRSICSMEEARREILRCAGSQFDPLVAEAFLQLDDRALEELD